MIQVTKNVYVETGIMGCDLGFVTTKEGIIVIDTPIRPSDAVKWNDTINKKGAVRYVINTEEHPDHSQSSWFFKGVLITHQVTREKLAKAPTNEVFERIKRMDPEGMRFMEGFQLRLADITFSENLTFYLGGHTFHLFHLPGHSPGGIGVYIPEERLVFATDTVFNRFKSWLHESDPSQWFQSLDKLRALDVDFIVPGHGDVCNKEHLEEQENIVHQWVSLVKSAIKKGLSEEEAMVQVSCPDPYPKQAGTPMTEELLNRATIARLYHLYAKKH